MKRGQSPSKGTRIARTGSAAPARTIRPEPPRDERWQGAVRELAKRTGRNAEDLLDQWDERAAVREYLGNVTRDEAERLAFEDVQRQYEPQLEIAA